MDKYTGCNIVESVVKPAPKTKIRKRVNAWIVKLVIACAVIAIIAVVAFVPSPSMEAVRDAFRTVFCYDIFGRSDIGSSPIFVGAFGH